MSYMMPEQRKLLEGLQHVNLAYMSASEHNAAMDLCARGLAYAWVAQDGGVIWRITDEGRAVLTTAASQQAGGDECASR